MSSFPDPLVPKPAAPGQRTPPYTPVVQPAHVGEGYEVGVRCLTTGQRSLLPTLTWSDLVEMSRALTEFLSPAPGEGYIGERSP